MEAVSPSEQLRQPTLRQTPPWIFGILYGGTFNGFVAVSLAQLLPERGVSLARESEIAALILTASYVSFLLTPLVDCGMPRRVWALCLAVIAAACLCAAVPLLPAAAANGGHGAGTNALMLLLFLGYLCNQMYTSTIGGMVPNLVVPAKHGAVSAWLNVSYLAWTGLGGELAVWEIRHLPTRVAAPLAAVPILLGAVPLIWTHERRTLRSFAATAKQLYRDLAATTRQRSFMYALLVFLVPSATFALQNLFGDMIGDFHAEHLPSYLSVGAMLTVGCMAGAAVGGPLSSRIDRRLLFIAPAMLAGVGSLLMAAGPHTAATFVAGMLFYNLMAGINYTAFSALVFEIVGRNNPLSSTQYSICTATANLAIAGAVFLDGRGSVRHGAAGSLLVDAVLSIVLGAVVLLLVGKFGGGFPRPSQREY